MHICIIYIIYKESRREKKRQGRKNFVFIFVIRSTHTYICVCMCIYIVDASMSTGSIDQTNSTMQVSARYFRRNNSPKFFFDLDFSPELLVIKFLFFFYPLQILYVYVF